MSARLRRHCLGPSASWRLILGVLSRCTVYNWYQLGLIHAVATDKTGRHLYRPDQQPPNRAQITAARLQARAATARSRTSTSRSGAIISARHTSKDIESSTGGAV